MAVEVIGVDHVYLAVRDLEASQRWYDRVMAALGFRKAARPLAGGDLHVHYFNRSLQLSLRPARVLERGHDPYAPGLHHLCLRVRDAAAVDAALRELEARGVEATAPRLYPEYHEDYYALFLNDPDGIRLEVVSHLAVRRAIADRWSSFPPIPDPEA